MTVRELSAHLGVSVRTLRYYDEIGLLKPQCRTEQGYRDYDAAEIRRLRLILALRTLQFSLKQIKALLEAPQAEWDAALERHLCQLEAKRESLDNRIALTTWLRVVGTERLEDIDTRDIDAQMARARRSIDDNAAFMQFKTRANDYTDEQWAEIEQKLLTCFSDIGRAADGEADACIDRFKDFIEEHFYPCTREMLLGYACMFGGTGILGRQVDALSGPDTAVRARRAIERYCQRMPNGIGERCNDVPGQHDGSAAMPQT